MNALAKKPRLRLAPSPTGFLHLGNLRTALFGYLLAKHWGGSFILRIEDTDEKRFVPGAIESLVKIFQNLGIAFDEGPEKGGAYGPYVQSERLAIYKEKAQELIDKGDAYYCFAAAEELEAMRQEQVARHEPPRYDRRYRDLPPEEAKQRIAKGETYVIRHKMPLSGTITVHDELRGDISFAAEQLEDYVLLKSDGYPTYQLASVVDDHLMEISHVTRGEEWIPSLPKNILLYKALGWEAPLFIHLPLILNKTGGKLSKRQGDVFVEDYLNKGYLKDALINFCALLGWHPKDEQEFFTLNELEKSFDINGIGISPAVFDQEKLDFINGHYIRNLSLDELLDLSKPFLAELLSGADKNKNNSEFIKAVIALEQPRLKTLNELSESTAFFFAKTLSYEKDLLIWKSLSESEIKSNLNELQEKLAKINESEWQTKDIENVIVSWLKADNKKLGDYLWPMRVALSGLKASPGPFEIAAVLGKEETIEKITFASSLLS
ncbi:MAG: glutamate--tRNA ligase [Candidatus Falkowbacteria bacterium]|nr:glutamate--tRNA ligase [Candidatus Falkowbacteria bacterium]